jgi:hypothetical protein
MEDFKNLMIGFYNLGNLRETARMTTPMVSYFANDRPLKSLLELEKGDFGKYLIPLPAPSGMKKAKIGLWCKWDFTLAKPTCSVQVMFAKDVDKTWGFRVEGPHDARDGILKHGYWHCQFTLEFKEPGIMFPKCKAHWIDPSTPSYPIALETPDEVRPQDALVYTLISIYGQEIHPSIRTLLMTVSCSSSLRIILFKTKVP